MTASESALAQSFFGHNYKKQKDRFGCTTGLWTMCGELLTIVLALFWIGFGSHLLVSLAREKKEAQIIVCFSELKEPLGFFWECLGKKERGKEFFCSILLSISFSLSRCFVLDPPTPPLFLKKKEEGKRERKKTREERFFYLMPFSDKKVCIAKHLFVCNQISKKAQSQCKKYFTKEKGCFLWNFSGHCGKFFFSPRSKRRKAFWLPKTFLAEIRGEEEKKKRLELYSFFWIYKSRFSFSFLTKRSPFLFLSLLREREKRGSLLLKDFENRTPGAFCFFVFQFF